MADRLAEKLVPPLGAERLERQWRGIERRTRGRFWLPRGQWRLALSGVVVVAAVALVLLFRPSPSSPQAVAGGAFDNSGTGPASLRLLDGSQLQVSPTGRVEFEALASDNVELALSRGWMELDVTHVPGRRFVVRAGEVDVVVRGTQFRVELTGRDPQVVKVSVTRDRVDVLEHHTGALALQLGAGMSWTMGQRELPKDASAAPRSPAPPEAASSEPSPKSPAREPPEDAKKLMELADSARLAGRTREAASALDTLRKRFRGDARAGLAALELGRLRLDSFHDAAGALEAFRDAARLSASPSVREDALARQAQALEVLGDVAGCERVRDSYLSRYPRGIHSASIAKRCGGK
jgi:hypothetical protein